MVMQSRAKNLHNVKRTLLSFTRGTIQQNNHLTCFKRFLISEPFHFQCGISYRDETTFKMSSLPFSNSINILQWLCKYRTLPSLWLLHFRPLEWCCSLKLTNLLQTFWALWLQYNITLCWNMKSCYYKCSSNMLHTMYFLIKVNVTFTNHFWHLGSWSRTETW